MTKINSVKSIVVFSICVISFVLISSQANADQCSAFDLPTNTLHIPCFDIDNLSFWIDLGLVGSELELKNFASEGNATNDPNCATFDFLTNTLHIPCFIFNNTNYWLDLEYIIPSNPIRFRLKSFGNNNQINLTGTFTGTLNVATTNCRDQDGYLAEGDDDAFTLLGSIRISDNFDGTFNATGVLEINRYGFVFTLNLNLSGTVNTAGELRGTYTETFKGTNGFSSSGNGDFTGSVTDNTLSIQISGQDIDMFGTTCDVNGSF